MVKIRSKLKRNSKGKTWSKGQSSTSNPSQMKHRLKAKSRFFQSDLSLATSTNNASTSRLTREAVLKHEQRQVYNAETTTVNDVAGSLKSFKLSDGGDDEDLRECNVASLKTFGTQHSFASDYSSCTNITFKKLLYGFRASSELHREMLAILTALTEIIKKRDGSGSSTEYFILIMEQIEAIAKTEGDLFAGVSLLTMVIKSVPAAVLRKEFDSTAQTLMNCLKKFIECNNQSAIKAILGCLSVLLRGQDYATWTYSSTWQYIDAILSFTIHSKPKIRKVAQHAIVAIIHGSSFMLPTPKPGETGDTTEQQTVETTEPKITYHPAGSRVAKFCLNHFKPEVLANSQTTMLHTLTLLKDTISGFKTDDIRTVCESLLSVMTASNVLIRTNCFHTLHSLFASRTKNLTSNLCAKLLAAIDAYRPNHGDVRQTLAWLTVVKEGHIHLATLDLSVCIAALPHFVDICCSTLCMSSHYDIISGISNCIRELLYECVKPACATRELAEQHRVSISRIIATANKVLNAPFSDATKYVVLTFTVIFEVCGEYFGDELRAPLATLAKRYDTKSDLRLQIEHAVIAAIKTIGPDGVLKTVPLTNAKGEVVLENSWLLPLLREGTSGASLKFFKDVVLPLAFNCNDKWTKYAAEKQVALSHTYELLCCQLWGLFPGFSRRPKDPEHFHLLAPTLGKALENNPEFRSPIFDGLIELISNEDQIEVHEALAKYAKNFLPRLFNIYSQKPNGTYEADVREKSLKVVKLYLTKTSGAVLKELYETVKNQLLNTPPGSFEYDSFYDVAAALVLFQTSENIRNFFETFMIPVLKNEKSDLVSKDEQKLKKQQRKTYELLRDILTSEAASCQKFTRQNLAALQKLLLDAFSTSCSVCQAARLRCLKLLIENRKTISINDKIVMKAIPEAVISFKEFSTHRENIADEIIEIIGRLYQEADKLNDFIDILTAGFTGDESLITNTILAYRAVLRHQGKHLTISTLEFVLEQVSVFLVQKSRAQAEASVAFLITFIKVMPTPLIANHLEVIMKSLSAMTKDTKRYCRIQIGYLLKKLCKRFTAEELIKFVPGDDEVTHRRLKKIRKQIRRDSRKKLSEDDDDSDDDFITGLEKRSATIDDILNDSDSDLSMEGEEEAEPTKTKTSSKKAPNTFIREDPEDIVDLADIKSIGSILTNHPNIPGNNGTPAKAKGKEANRGFKVADDGRLIISDKALRDSDGDISSSDADGEGDNKEEIKNTTRRGMEEDSSDDGAENFTPSKRKRKAADSLSMRSGKTSTSRYTTGGKGIHRTLGGGASDAVSMKSGCSTKTSKSNAYAGSEYSAKKAKGDVKKKGKLDPYAYIPLSRNTLNKRKHAKHSRVFKNLVTNKRKDKLKGVKIKLQKKSKK